MSNTNLTIGIAVAVLIAIGAYFFPQVKGASSQLFGSTACSSITCLSGGLRLVTDAGGDFEADVASIFAGAVKVGTNGTSQTQQLNGTCNLVGSPSITATSTAAMDCAISNVVVGDRVFMMMATTSKTTFGGWTILSDSASSTSGFVTAVVANFSGATGIPPIGATSSVQYWIVR